MAAPGTRGPSKIARSADRLPVLWLRKRLARGDRRAFEMLFERHHQELYRYCMAILRDPDDAQDALQATMAAALESLPGDTREIEPRPWLFRVAHNKAISILRDRTHEELVDGEIPSTGGDIAEEHVRRERLSQLMDDLGTLPDRQRSALVMRELNDLGYAEIAAVLGCREGAARQSVYEARTALREREEGREMDCEEIRRSLSDGDRRRLRGRRLRAHLRQCDACLAFQKSIEDRRQDLRTLTPPISPALAAPMIAGLFAGTGTGGAGLAGGAVATGMAGSFAAKGASVAAGVAVAVGAAQMTGVIELPRSEQSSASPSTLVQDAPRSTSTPAATRSQAARTAAEQRARASSVRARSRSAARRENPDGKGEVTREARRPESSAPAQEGSPNVPAPAAPGTLPERGNSDAAPGITGQTPGQGDIPPPGTAKPPGTPASPPSRPPSPEQNTPTPSPPPHAAAPESPPAAGNGAGGGPAGTGPK